MNRSLADKGESGRSGRKTRRRDSTLAAALTLVVLLWYLAPARGQQTEAESFELRGVVINAATGEPVSRALVELNAQTAEMQLSGTNGSF
ncbi:MAG: hypothetical protein WBR10_15540, partial [Candidatus Acidiferrum sp.]